MQYSKEQFEAAFQLITAVSHQIIKIDFAEMEIWVGKLMSAKALTDPVSKTNLENLKAVLQEFQKMQSTLMGRGIPVRDIKHYTDSRPIEGEKA